jgi:hypothetical protein
MSKLRRLPNGKTTRSTETYLLKWNKVIESLTFALEGLGYKVNSCDPDIRLVNKNITVYLPMDIVHRIILLDKNRKENRNDH